MRVKIVGISKKPELNVEKAARTCYASTDKMSEEANGNFLKSLVKKEHLSVLEFTHITFSVEDVSRALLAQLSRHRVGISLAVQSQRYVDQAEFDYVTPVGIRDSEHIMRYHDLMEALKDFYSDMVDSGIKKEDARFILPQAGSTTFLVCFNLRSLRDFLIKRLNKAAQWEIRELALNFLKQVKIYAPNIFSDLIEEHLTLKGVIENEEDNSPKIG